MADDIVTRLRDVAVMTEDRKHETLAWRAADEIVRLRALVKSLQRQLLDCEVGRGDR